MEGATQEARFRALYDTTHLQVLSYCLRRTPDRDSAMDVAAETYVVAWRRFDDLPRGTDGDRLVWLFAVARRVLDNHRRAEGRRSRAHERDRILNTDERVPSPESATIHEEEKQRVLDAMQQLSDDDQKLLRLREWEGLSGLELARYF
ncbi:MAG: RNA polymerase sigma factor, partial [Nitriliruptorales bacterium]|nr:RNA polymerase sigma factor [Nitriliruptorales bacterium]